MGERAVGAVIEVAAKQLGLTDIAPGGLGALAVGGALQRVQRFLDGGHRLPDRDAAESAIAERLGVDRGQAGSVIDVVVPLVAGAAKQVLNERGGLGGAVGALGRLFG